MPGDHDYLRQVPSEFLSKVKKLYQMQIKSGKGEDEDGEIEELKQSIKEEETICNICIVPVYYKVDDLGEVITKKSVKNAGKCSYLSLVLLL